MFLYKGIPKLKEQFTLQKVVKNAHSIFKPEVTNNKIILLHVDNSTSLYRHTSKIE